MGTGSNVTAGPKPDTFHFPLDYSGRACICIHQWKHDADTDTRAHTWRPSPLDNLLFTVASLMPVVSSVQQQVSTWFLVLNHLHVSEKETFTHRFTDSLPDKHIQKINGVWFLKTKGIHRLLGIQRTEQFMVWLITLRETWVRVKNTNDCHVSPLVPFTALNEMDNLPFTVERKWIPLGW